ncbi:hypothetical protein ASPFODRAFT_38441 [Aspergillus luchuensis CBS 106.47]|uniref:Uncharacterized protein n=1 Tax=Aspergillus luchuensis (strain CBS 106.47) TaxID=1137211 RepID=A0A1M3SZS0_ASPLC|nr:hypothetical protein ASPFODRAFT_38441 [Aspergillus luchuensis CBS 106.47]
MSNKLESSMQKEHSRMRGDDRLAAYLETEIRKCGSNGLALPDGNFLYGRFYSTLAIRKSLPVDTAPAESLRDWAFRLIESDAQDIAYRIRLQRYHTMALYHKRSRASAQSTSGFLAMNNNGDFDSRKPGNCLYKSEADMAKRILKEVAPGFFEPESPVYKHKLDHIKSRRIRCKGYPTLFTHFGPGILALIPSTDQPDQNRIGLSENE